MPDVNKQSSNKQQLSSGVKYEYLPPAAEQPDEIQRSAQENTASLADLMSKFKSL